MKKKVVIIGGGAAGFFCASNLDEALFDILILEQNTDVLQKVKISGGGRCNVSHACFDPRDLVKFYPRGSKELLSVFSKFQPEDTMDWFESRAVPLKIENDNRIFPESNSSKSIIEVFKRETAYKNVHIHTQTTVRSITKTENYYKITTNKGDFTADYIIYTTGSSPKSIKILEQLGHKIISPVPSLFTFNIKDDLLKDLPGTSFENAEVKIPQLKSQESGSLLITHWGLSAPAILKLSAWNARELNSLNYHFNIKVNFISKTIQEAEEEMWDFKQNYPKKTIAQSKISGVTQRFWNKVLEVIGINPNKQISQINKKEISKIVETLCNKTFSVEGKSTFKEEFVTAGGVDLKEIDFKTMASKLLPNFYIAGEVLNIDALTGGFNFQACWSEAWLIAQDLNTKVEPVSKVV